jgi:charged multivesicular body protein 2A
MFGKEKPLKEIIRENQRMLRKAIRELEKEVENLKKQDKKLEMEIKKSAKMGQMTAAKIMAKDLVRTRNYVTRFIEMKTHLNAVSLKMQTIKSHEAMASAMKGVTKALISMNSKMNIPGLQKVMAEFLRENERAELTQEALADTLDDAMAEEGSSEQEDLIVNKVLPCACLG